jgi:hypothetical protein
MTPRDKKELYEEVMTELTPEAAQKFLRWNSKPWNRYKYGTVCGETLQRLAEIAART